MARKHRKTNKKRSTGGHRKQKQSPRSNNSGKIVLSEDAVNSRLTPGIKTSDFKTSDFKTSGYRCRDCDWSTSKTGSSGLQALRAHRKRHVYDRRARLHPLYRQFVVVLLSFLLFVVPELIDAQTVATIVLPRWEVPDPIRRYVLPMAVLLFAANGALVFVSWLRFLATGLKRWSSRFTFFSNTSLVLLIVSATSRWIADDVPYVESVFLAALIPWFIATVTASQVGTARLAIRRKEFTPNNQLRLLKSKSVEIDMKIKSIAIGTRARIRDGRIQLERLSKSERKVMKGLGVSRFRINPRQAKERLNRDRAAKEGKVKREGRSDRRSRRKSRDQD